MAVLVIRMKSDILGQEVESISIGPGSDVMCQSDLQPTLTCHGEEQRKL